MKSDFYLFFYKFFLHFLQTWQTHTSYNQRYRLCEIRPTSPARWLATRYVWERPYKKINRQHKLQLDTISFLGRRRLERCFVFQMLEEVCIKNRWGNPSYQLHSTVGCDGSGDVQLFMFKVCGRFIFHKLICLGLIIEFYNNFWYEWIWITKILIA